MCQVLQRQAHRSGQVRRKLHAMRKAVNDVFATKCLRKGRPHLAQTRLAETNVFERLTRTVREADEGDATPC
jgi:hypothetical protein